MKFFITGISSGIGKVLTKYILGQGHEVWGIARREPLLKELSRELKTVKLKWSVCDAGDRMQLTEVQSQMKGQNFIPQVCILNAGVSRYDLQAPLNPALCDEMVSSNFQGIINCLEIFNNDMQMQNGQFILISSIFALLPDSRSPVYSASKAASSMLMRSLRLNRTLTGIRYKNVYLGPVQTEVNREKKIYIPTIENTARFIADSVVPANKNDFYYPFAAWLACKVLLLLPDGLFNRLTSSMRRK